MILRCASCNAANRVPTQRLLEHPRCGRCKSTIDTAVPLALSSISDFDDLVANATVPVLVDFWAPWCGPCHAVAPQLALLAKKKEGTLLVAKVNTDELPELGARFAIRSIPTMVLFADGHEARRLSGAMPADAIAHGIGV
jgi:thioredoxin 2